MPLIGDRNLSVIYVFGPRLQGFFRFSKAGDAGFLVVNTAIDEHGVRSTDLWADTSEERCIEYVRLALGDPEIAVEIENVQRWNACAEWAATLQDGRVFIVGDAAHNMPPTGGFGGNTGVQDGHNLAWKLAAVLDGSAGPELLGTYDAERRAVAEFTVEQAYTRYVLRLAPELGKENLQPIVPEATVELGYRYRSAAVILEPADDGAMVEDPLAPSACPGARAPHLVVTRNGGDDFAPRPLRPQLRPACREQRRGMVRGSAERRGEARGRTGGLSGRRRRHARPTTPGDSTSCTEPAPKAPSSSAPTASSRGG